MNPLGTRATGDLVEKLAAKFLRRKGLSLQTQNYYCRVGELDLVMWHNDCLVFVEVRYRRQSNYGSALESIDHRKQATLRRAAEHYLMHTKTTDCPCRFDILCVEGSLSNPRFEWIQNAF